MQQTPTRAKDNAVNDSLLLEVEGLKTHFFLDEGTVKAVDGIDFNLYRNRTLCVVGESGCGKSVTARSILQVVDEPGRIVDGQVRFHANSDQPIDLAALDPRGPEIRAIRGKDIAMIFQEPMTSMSPVHTVGNQIIELIRLHMPLNEQEARERAITLLNRVGIPKPEQRIDSYTFELSGGMRQRVMIAMALACNPSLLIADEPTTALDVTTQAQILDLMHELQADYDMAIMLITHDLGVVAEMADDVIVMYLGQIVERGSVDEIFHDPKHPYTRALLRSIPTVGTQGRRRLDSIHGMIPNPYHRPDGCQFHNRCDYFMEGICDQVVPAMIPAGSGRDVRCLLYGGYEGELPIKASELPEIDPFSHENETLIDRTLNGSSTLLETKNLKMHFPIQRGFLRRTVGHVKAVDDVDLFIREGETLGLVGESGCGKTTAGRCIVRAYQPTDGQIIFEEAEGEQVDLAPLSNRELKPYRRQIRMIFQDPHSSLNPRMSVLEIVGDPLIVNRVASGKALEEHVANLLERVGLRPEYMRRYPHAFSGGERQRIGIARALALNPKLVIADEAVSALDVSVRAQILNLLQDLQEEFHLTYLFISHDLSVIEYICDRVAVMYVGKIVELAETQQLYASPKHPYTEALLSALPKPDPRMRQSKDRIILEGDVADPANPPSGCYFHPRCRFAEERCRIEAPALRKLDDGRSVACHFAEELELRGAVQ